jgi:hypothetical protein
MSQLNHLLESANNYKSLQSDAARLADKWSKTGLLEGMGSEQDKNNMSMILENQAKQLVTENTQTGGGTGTFNPGTGAAGQWAGVALPLVRKVFGQIAAKEFVSVQPMNLPSGLVFYLDFQYGGTQVNSPVNAANANKLPFNNGTSLYGTPSPVNPATNTSGFGNAAAGGLYGAGRFGYSTQNFNTVVGGQLTDCAIVGNADWYLDLDADSTYPFALTGVAAAAVTGLQTSAATTVTKVSAPATRAIVGTAAVPATTLLQTFADMEAIEGFYLTDNAAGNALLNVGGVQLPAFTKVDQGAVLPVPAQDALIVAGSSKTGCTVSSPGGAAVVAGAAAAGAGVDDLNVAPTTSTSANGVGFTMDFIGLAAGQPIAIVNNPGRGYAAGDVLTWTAAANPNTTATCTFTIVAANIPAAGVISFFGTGTISAAGVTGGWVVDLGGGVNSTVTGFNAQQTLQPSDNNRGDFEDGNAALGDNSAAGGALYNTPIAIPEINVQMRSEAIVAKTRKLKAVWTPEFAQDLNAYHSLDAEAELTSIMSEYISLEIDQEILSMLIESAGAGDEYWSATNNLAIGAGGVVNANLNFFNSQGQWFQTLGTKVQKLSNIIHQRTLRGGANFMVCSPTVATIIESIPGFSSNSDGDAAKMSYAFGVQKAGSMNGRYQVYKNPYMTDNTILLGYRGGQFLEAGAVFSPYIPLIMTPLVYDPTTFTPRKGLLTRYAKKMLRPEFYGRIFVSNLNTL